MIGASIWLRLATKGIGNGSKPVRRANALMPAGIDFALAMNCDAQQDASPGIRDIVLRCARFHLRTEFSTPAR
jgi:hypothetical protein